MKRIMLLLLYINTVLVSYGQGQYAIIWHGYIDKSTSLRDVVETDLSNEFLIAIQECDENSRYFKFIPSYSSVEVPNSTYTLEGFIDIERNNNGKRITTRLIYEQKEETGTPCSDIVSPNYFTKKVKEHARKKYDDLVKIFIPEKKEPQSNIKSKLPELHIPETVNNNFNFLPLGVHQFVNKRYGKGILFVGTQIGGGVGTYFFAKGAIDTNDKLRCEPYQSAARERELKNSRNWQIVGAATFFLGTAAMFWWNYCDNHDKNFFLKPIAMLDEKGKPQMGMCLSFNF